jgi:F-type H+-transporting ATPase subunit b
VLIDWFTVVAQIINFLVLMALLKIFLFDRVIRVMEEREKKIADRLDEAEQKRREAAEREEKIAAEERDLEEKREKMLFEARRTANSKQKELERQARSEIDALRDRWTEALDQEKEDFAASIRRTAAKQVFAVTRRVLTDMADNGLQERLLDTFAEQLKGMPNEDKRELVKAVGENRMSTTILSAAEIATAKRRSITRLLHEEIHPDIEVDYQTDGKLLAGLELRVPGKKISWNLDRHLEELEQKVFLALEEPLQEKKNEAADRRDDGKKEASQEK